MTKKIPLGPLMIDIEGDEMTETDITLLQNPQVGGIILFSRNFVSHQQIKKLCTEIHSLRTPPLLIAVDHEGGRVQRFKEGFTRIPPMAQLGKHYEADPESTLQHCHNLGWLMARELLDVGVDFSFAPILDVECGISDIIGDRSFHTTPEIVTALSQAWIAGMHEAGMAATGKHFPGHGSVKEDSHVAIPVDDRSLEEITEHDLQPFKTIIASGLEGIMPAHVYYPKVDPEMPAGFSKVWLQTILRKELGFDGVIFSDDLSMEGATAIGSFTERAQAALDAGCDMVLVCNHREGALEVIEDMQYYIFDEKSRARLSLMHGQFTKTKSDFTQTALQSLVVIQAST